MSRELEAAPAAGISQDAAPKPQVKRRKLTEKRRAQNREAQRQYRERKRKQLFENLTKSTEPGFWTTDESLNPEDGSGNEITIHERIPENAQTPVFPSISTSSPKEDELNMIARRIYELDRDNSIARQKSRGVQDDDFTSRKRLVSLQWLLNDGIASAGASSERLATVNGVTNQLDAHILATQSPSLVEVPTEALSVSPSELRGSSPSGTSDLSLSEHNAIIHTQNISTSPNYRMPPSFPAQSNINSVGLNTSSRSYNLQAGNEQSGYSLMEVIKAGMEALSSKEQNNRSSPEEPVDTPSTSIWRDPIENQTQGYLRELLFAPPSPVKTFIGLQECAFLNAVIINAERIGMLNPVSSDFKDPFGSPFVQAYFASDQNLQAVKQKHTDIPRHLRPTDKQYQAPHRAYIDVFPFPRLRENLIDAAGPSFFELSEMEFCCDLGRNSMICWGSGNGKNGGQPWDPRSWEAKPWFLKKWAMVLDDDLKESSRWWRNLRGESVEELD